MKSLNLPSAFPHQATLVFTDVDETLTWQGRLPVETFQALFALQQAGVRVVPVTGACAGWCECMLRTWPIDSIIGENGAFYIDRDKTGKLNYTFALPQAEREANKHQLLQLQQNVLQQFPTAQLTTDQSFRLTDMAFDIGQDFQMERSAAQRSVSLNFVARPALMPRWGQYISMYGWDNIPRLLLLWTGYHIIMLPMRTHFFVVTHLMMIVCSPVFLSPLALLM